MNLDSIKKAAAAMPPGNLNEVAPDRLWAILDDLEAAAGELATAVSAIENHLMNINYSPPEPVGA